MIAEKVPNGVAPQDHDELQNALTIFPAYLSCMSSSCLSRQVAFLPQPKPNSGGDKQQPPFKGWFRTTRRIPPVDNRVSPRLAQPQRRTAFVLGSTSDAHARSWPRRWPSELPGASAPAFPLVRSRRRSQPFLGRSTARCHRQVWA
jgi:hypothetical protein